MRVLIVEDELLVAMEIEFILKSNGIAVSGCASNISEAQNIVRQQECTFALVDINLSGGPQRDAGGGLSEKAVQSPRSDQRPPRRGSDPERCIAKMRTLWP